MSGNKKVWRDAGKLPEILSGEPQTLHAGELDLVVLRSTSGLKVFEGRCPHQGALLGEGEQEEGLLICRNHRWKFDTETGERQGGRPVCLKQYQHKVEDGRLWVELADERAASDDTGKKLRQPEELPGPKGSLLLGNAGQIETDSLHTQLEAWAEEFGTPYTLRFATRRIVVISDPEVIAIVLRARPETWRRSRRVQPIFEEMGVDGVFSSEGKSWRPQRKLAVRALSHRNLKGFYPVLHTMASRLHERWAKVADTGEAIDIQSDLMRFTVDVTTMLAFGHDVNTLEKGDDVIQRYIEPIFPIMARRLNAIIPYWRFLRLPRDREVDRSLAALRDWLSPIVAATRERLERDPGLAERPSNFLESMLSSKDENGELFSEERVFGNAMTMLLAGEDTTANTLAWAIHHLLDRPESVQELQREVDASLAGQPVPADIETAESLRFAAAIANETMRVRPVAPLFFVDCNHDTVVGDVAIDSRTSVGLLIRPSATDEEVMPQGKSFVPERWLDPSTAEAAQQKLVHTPFGSGPRICPGRSLALLEMNIVLATLYKNFRVERVGRAQDVAEKFSFTMTPVGLRVRLHSRTRDAQD